MFQGKNPNIFWLNSLCNCENRLFQFISRHKHEGGKTKQTSFKLQVMLTNKHWQMSSALYKVFVGDNSDTSAMGSLFIVKQQSSGSMQIDQIGTVFWGGYLKWHSSLSWRDAHWQDHRRCLFVFNHPSSEQHTDLYANTNSDNARHCGRHLNIQMLCFRSQH